jgi:putative endonuclease
MFHTYIIFSEKVNRYYVGSTQDLDDRLRRHNAGHSKSTKGKGPWTLITSFSFKTRSEAMALETKIKKRGAKRFLDERKESW